MEDSLEIMVIINSNLHGDFCEKNFCYIFFLISNICNTLIKPSAGKHTKISKWSLP